MVDITLSGLQDCVDLMVWSQSQDGLVVSVTSDPQGDLVVQCEGFTVPTVQARIGDTVSWDGFRFTVVSPEQPEPELPPFVAPPAIEDQPVIEGENV